MAQMVVIPANIRPLLPSQTAHYTLDAAADVGDLMYMKSDGEVANTDANAALTVEAYGLILAIEGGKSAGVAGDRVTLALPGSRIAGFKDLVPGTIGYVSENAGEIADTAPVGAGSWTKVVGRAESATVFYLDIDAEPAASNS